MALCCPACGRHCTEDPGLLHTGARASVQRGSSICTGPVKQPQLAKSGWAGTCSPISVSFHPRIRPKKAACFPAGLVFFSVGLRVFTK